MEEDDEEEEEDDEEEEEDDDVDYRRQLSRPTADCQVGPSARRLPGHNNGAPPPYTYTHLRRLFVLFFVHYLLYFSFFLLFLFIFVCNLHTSNPPA